MTRRPTNARVELGNALDAAGHYREAVATYQAAIRLRPDDPRAYNELATAHFNQRCWPAAIATYQQVIQLQADFAGVHLRLGDSFLQIGREAEAMAAYREAVRLDPRDAEARLALANLYLRQQRQTEAAAELSALEQLNCELAEKLRAQLKSGRLQSANPIIQQMRKQAGETSQ